MAKSKSSGSYNPDDIKVYKGLEGVRKRPAMYIGDTSDTGHTHMLWEILDNSVDEAIAGHCDTIVIEIKEDGSASVSDNGRGVPVQNHPTEKIPTLDVVMTMLHAGGKFDNKSYSVSGGLHGVGASVVNALSTWVDVVVKREGKEYFRRYEKGTPVGAKGLKILGKVGKRDTGTKVTFLPDSDIFKRCEFRKDVIVRRLRELAFLNAGTKFDLIWKGSEVETFESEGGLSEYVKYLISGKKMLHDPIHIEGDISGCHVDVAFAYDSEYDETIKTFANNISTIEGGVHHHAALDALCKTIEKIAESNKMLKGLENLGVNKSDIVEGLTLVINVMVPDPQFGGQTKTKLVNADLRNPLGDWLIEMFMKNLVKDKELGKLLALKIVDAIKARDAARKAKSLSRKKNSVYTSTLPGKLADCTSHDREVSELFIVEGDSAGGTAIEARDRTFQAILPLRGKVLNVGKTTLNKALDNKEIGSLISALGVTVTHRDVDLEGLRYDKVIIMADADADGGHICCLLLTLFHKFMRKLIEEGHLYVCDLPLYRVRMGSNSFYVKDDEALDEVKSKNSGKKMEISRFKGLGEMNTDELEETAMSATSRRLKKVHIEDAIEALKMFECLMGDDSAARKEMLATELRLDEEN